MQIIDEYDIINEKQFEIKQIIQMINNYQLHDGEVEILNRQIIEQYCKYSNIDVNYNIQPQYQNKNGETIALWIAQQHLIPPLQFYHNKYLRCKYQNNNGQIYYYTVQNILQQQNIEVPDEWKYDILNCNEDNFAITDARKGLIPQLNNDPSYQNIEGDTVATILASKGIIPSSQWQHKQDLQNANGDTVALILVKQRITPPKQWMHNIDLQNNNKQSITSILQKIQYIYIDGKFVFNCQIQVCNDICQICFNECEQEFIETWCEHNICFSCFQKLLKQHNINRCPICRQNNWYKIHKSCMDACFQYQYKNNQFIE